MEIKPRHQMRIPPIPPSLDDLLTGADMHRRLLRILDAGAHRPTINASYYPWDRIRHMTPPGDLTPEEWWIGIKLARQATYRSTPILDRNGLPFRYALVDPLLEATSRIDRDASGRIEIGDEVTNPENRDRYLVSSLIEEAASSSILEGAATTVQRARDMIRSGDEPRDRGERMILNNYAAMRRIQELTSETLTPEIVFELHRILTDETLQDPGAAGRLRRSGNSEDSIVVMDARDGTTLHVPPDASELPDRLVRMCAFANEEGSEVYYHPVLRAILLHFWLAYDHPFTDGNGRTARALFYWSMLKQGYWLTSFVSISSILRRAPSRYAYSFLYSETDDNDLTYFILDQLDVLRRAIDALHEYLARKTREIRAVEKLLRPSAGMNHRQLALLGHALRHPGGRYTYESHQSSHEVVYQTARTDLLDLERRGLLVMRKVGARFVFRPAPDLVDRLRVLDE
jgi:Fic family protein